MELKRRIIFYKYLAYEMCNLNSNTANFSTADRASFKLTHSCMYMKLQLQQLNGKKSSVKYGTTFAHQAWILLRPLTSTAVASHLSREPKSSFYSSQTSTGAKKGNEVRTVNLVIMQDFLFLCS